MKRILSLVLCACTIILNMNIVSASAREAETNKKDQGLYEIVSTKGTTIELGDERLKYENSDKTVEQSYKSNKHATLKVKDTKAFTIDKNLEEVQNLNDTVSDAVYSGDATILAALPDIKVSNLVRAAGQPNPFIGLQDSEVTVTIENIGSASTGSFLVGIECDNVYQGGFNISDMAANTGTIYTIVLSGFPAGSYSIKVVGDYNNNVVESNESNNTVSQTFTWSGKPNLRADSISTFGSYPYYTDSDLGVRFRVTNTGNANINQNCTIEIRIDGGILLTYTVSYWPVGAYLEDEFYIRFYNAGTYNLEVRADPYNYIDEQNESDNNKSTNVIIQVAPQITVSGTVIANIRPNNSQPAQSVRMSSFPVKIMCQNLLFNETLGTGYTDSNGQFNITVNHKSGGTNIYVKLEFSDSIVNIKSQGLFGTTHSWTTNTIPNCQLRTLDVGNIPQNASETINGAFSIWKWIKQGYNYYSSASSHSIPRVDVLWESGVQAGTNANSSRISINGANSGYAPHCYDGDVILHEYGHFIMGNIIGFPDNSSVENHYWDAPSNPGCAYSEGWAHFFSCAARNSSQTLDWASNGNSFGANLNNATTLVNGTATPLSLQSNFLKNGEYELNAGAVMWDLFTGNQTVVHHPFSSIDNTMASNRSNSIYDFYNRWFSTINSQYTKEQIWNAFENRRCSYDVTVPTVSISAIGNTVSASATDDIGVVKYEWYVDGNFVSQGTTSSSTLTLGTVYGPGLHIVEFRAYDPEGMKSYSAVPDPTRPREARFGSNFVPVFVSGASSPNVSAAITEEDMLKSNPRNIKELHTNLVKSVNKKEKTQHEYLGLLTPNNKIKYKINVCDNEDIKVYSHIAGSVKEINIYSPKHEKYSTVSYISPDKPLEIKNASAGEWEIEMVYYTSEELKKMGANPNNTAMVSTPYSLIVTTVPTALDIELPKYTNDSYLLAKLFDSKSDDIIMDRNGSLINDYTLVEGLNKISISRKSGDYLSDARSYEIVLDTVAPEITLTQSVPKVTDQDNVLINGECSDDTNELYINDKPVMLGEWSNRSFAEGFMLNIGDNRFVLRAIDMAGNVTEKELIITRK